MDSEAKSNQVKPQFAHDDNLGPSQAAQPSYTSASRNAFFDASPSDTPLREIHASASSAQPGDPNSNSPPMACTPPSQPQSQPNSASQVPFGKTSVSTQCPVCKERMVTRTKHVAGGYTYGWALGLCAVTGLGCILFCVSRLKNVEHRCGNCNEKLATWHRYDGRVDVCA